MQTRTGFYTVPRPHIILHEILKNTKKNFTMETSLIGKALDFGSRQYGFESRVSNYPMSQHPYTHFLNHLKLASLRKRLSFKFRLTKKLKPLAKLLQSLNVIRRYHRNADNSYTVFPAYTHFRRYSRKIKAFTRSDGKIKLTLKALRILNISTPHTYYVLETPLGIITHKEAIRYSTGGNLLLTILQPV